MALKKFRWSQVYESSEEELINFLHDRNIAGVRIHAEAGPKQTEHLTKNESTIWCAEGSLRIQVDAHTLSLQPGDALRINAGSSYTIHPGITDCAYYLTN